MSKKVAKLVKVSLITRVIVNDNTPESEILEKAKSNLITKINYELSENLEEIIEDTECPYDSKYDFVSGEEFILEKSEEIYELLREEYVSSDVTSGEMIFSIKISMEYNESDVREGIQKFLDWDGSEETFNLKMGKKYWKVK